MVRKTAGVNPEGRQLVAARFDQLEIGRHFAFHESGLACDYSGLRHGSSSSSLLSSHDRVQASQPQRLPSYAAGHWRVQVQGLPSYPPVTG